MFETEHTSCDLCGSNNLESVHKTNLCVDTEEKIWHDVFFVICKNCGLIFENPRMSLKSMKKFYSDENSANMNFTFESRGKLARKEQFEFIKNFVSPNNKLLDIGGRDEEFVQFFDQMNCDVTILEPGPSLKNKSSKFRIMNDYYEDFEPKNKFDIISMRHVLEHTFSPTIFLEKAWKELSVGGKLFLEVPNSYKPGIQIVNYFIYYHTFNFTPISLESYLHKTGFKILKIQTDIPYRAIRIIAEKINSPHDYNIKNDYNSVKSVFDKYVTDRKSLIEKINTKLNKISNENIGIFGAGEHFIQLINSTTIDIKKIKCFIDSDPKKQGKNFFGLLVNTPNFLKTNQLDTIIISSYTYQDEIENIILKINPSIKIIKLYDEIIAYDTYG